MCSPALISHPLIEINHTRMRMVTDSTTYFDHRNDNIVC